MISVNQTGKMGSQAPNTRDGSSSNDWKSSRDCDQEAIMQVAIIAGLLFNTSYCDIQNSLRYVNPEAQWIQWDTYFIFITVGIYLLCTFFALGQWLFVRQITTEAQWRGHNSTLKPITMLLGLGVGTHLSATAYMIFDEFKIYKCFVGAVITIGIIA